MIGEKSKCGNLSFENFGRTTFPFQGDDEAPNRFAYKTWTELSQDLYQRAG